MMKMSIKDLRYPARHALMTYLLWLPVRFVLMAVIIFGGSVAALMLVAFAEGPRPIFVVMMASAFILLVATFLCAQWITIHLSLRYPRPIPPENPLHFAIVSTGIYVVLLLFLKWVFEMTEPQGIVGLVFSPFYDWPRFFPLWCNVIGMFAATYYELKRQAAKKS